MAVISQGFGWKFVARGDDLFDEMQRDALRSLQLGAAAGVREAKRLTSEKTWPPPSLPGEAPARRTGFLTESISWETTQGESLSVGDTLEVRIFVDAPYASFLEGGTRFMAPRPFLRPALQIAGNVFRNEIARRRLI